MPGFNIVFSLASGEKKELSYESTICTMFSAKYSLFLFMSPWRLGVSA